MAAAERPQWSTSTYDELVMQAIVSLEVLADKAGKTGDDGAFRAAHVAVGAAVGLRDVLRQMGHIPDDH